MRLKRAPRCTACSEQARDSLTRCARQLIRVIAELSDAAGAFLVRAVHHETRGWQWVSEPL